MLRFVHTDGKLTNVIHRPSPLAAGAVLNVRYALSKTIGTQYLAALCCWFSAQFGFDGAIFARIAVAKAANPKCVFFICQNCSHKFCGNLR